MLVEVKETRETKVGEKGKEREEKRALSLTVRRMKVKREKKRVVRREYL